MIVVLFHFDIHITYFIARVQKMLFIFKSFLYLSLLSIGAFGATDFLLLTFFAKLSDAVENVHVTLVTSNNFVALTNISTTSDLGSVCRIFCYSVNLGIGN